MTGADRTTTTTARQAPSEEELAAVLAALRTGGRAGAGPDPEEDTFTAWRRRRLTALGVKARGPYPHPPP
jgi:hypothetical protein